MQIKSLKINILSNTLHKIMIMLFPMLTYMYVVRVIGVERLGHAEYIRSFSGYFQTLSVLAIPIYATSLLASYRNQPEYLLKLKSNFYFIQTVLTLFSMVLFCIVAVIFNLWDKDIMLTAIWTIFIFSSMFNSTWSHHANERFDIVASASIIIRIIGIIAVFMFVKEPNDYLIYYFILLGLQLIDSILLYVFDNQRINLITYNNLLDFKIIISILKSMIFLYIPMLSASVISNLNKAIIGNSLGDTVLGYFSMSSKMVILIATFLSSVCYAFLPYVSRVSKTMEISKIKNLVRITQKTIMVVVIPTVIGIIMLSSELMKVFVGSEYSEAILSMCILAPMILFMTLKSSTIYQVLIPYKKEKQYAISSAVPTVFYIFLNVLFVPKFGLIGASVIMLITYVAQFFISSYYTSKCIGKYIFLKDFIKYLLLSVLIIPIVIIVRTTLLNYFATLIVSFIVCVTIYLALLKITKDECYNIFEAKLKCVLDKIFNSSTSDI